MFSSLSSTKPKDPDVMDVNIIHISKLTPDEQKCCIEKGLCFQCRKAGHLSIACPTFPSPKKIRRIQRKKEVEEILLLKEIENDEEEVV